MRGGDISNQVAPTILFDLNLLLEEKGKEPVSLWSKLTNIFTDKEDAPVINRVMRDKLIWIANTYDVNIGLFTFDLDWELEEASLHALLFKHYVPYNRIVFCTDENDLRRERPMFLFSGNGELVSVLSDMKAKNISELSEVLI